MKRYNVEVGGIALVVQAESIFSLLDRLERYSSKRIGREMEAYRCTPSPDGKTTICTSHLTGIIIKISTLKQ